MLKDQKAMVDAVTKLYSKKSRRRSSVCGLRFDFASPVRAQQSIATVATYLQRVSTHQSGIVCRVVFVYSLCIAVATKPLESI